MLHMRVAVFARARTCAGPLRRRDFLQVRCVEATFLTAAFAFAKLESPSLRGRDPSQQRTDSAVRAGEA